MVDRPRLVCIPSADLVFAAFAEDLLSTLPPELEDEAAVEELQRRLRVRYAGAVVRPRDALAEVVSNLETVWYVTHRPFRSRIYKTVSVALRVEDAFHVYVDRVADWQTAFRLRAVNIEPAIVGSRYVAVYEFFGRTLEGRFEIVAADPPRSVRIEADGAGVRVWYATTFTATPGGTLIEVVGDYDLPDGLLPRVADRLFVERAIQRQIDGAHQSLRELAARVAEMGPVPVSAAGDIPEVQAHLQPARRTAGCDEEVTATASR